MMNVMVDVKTILTVINQPIESTKTSRIQSVSSRHKNISTYMCIFIHNFPFCESLEILELSSILSKQNSDYLWVKKNAHAS